ncbi:MAG: hypothetical protein ACRD43_00280 [Pyrinomonadaceae bacterium]
MANGYANRVDYQIAKGLAMRKARIHGKSTWPFDMKKDGWQNVTAKMQPDGKLRTSIWHDTLADPKPGA